MIIPAIDIQNGESVRLYRGDYNQKTVYNHDPSWQARVFEKMGAAYLHVVDLDGAKHGKTINFDAIKNIRENVGIPIQLGGGIRSAETVALYLDELGINRVILGTAMVTHFDFLREMIEKHGAEKIVAGVDVRRNKVAVEGWTSDSGEDYLAFIERLREAGVKYIVLTDIARDGTLTSPNWELYEGVSGVEIIVSGGVSSEDDFARAAGYYAVIVGKAYYEGKVDLAKCLKNE